MEIPETPLNNGVMKYNRVAIESDVSIHISLIYLGLDQCNMYNKLIDFWN